MADLRIADAPEIDESEVQGGLKIPTGGFGNKAINMTTVANWVVKDKDLPSKDYVDTAVAQGNQGLAGHVANKNNPHEVTKEQVGLGNVDNTADADKPVSNSTQAAIISAVAPKADKSYVDNQLTLKSDKTYTDSQLALKASKVDVDSSLLTKSDKTYVDDQLSLKTDKTYTDSQLALKSDKTYVDSQDLSLQSQINQKATVEYLDNALTEQTQTVNTALSQLSTAASKFYPTLTEANADIVNLEVNQPVQVGESGANGGLWYKATAEATNLTKSDYDPLTQAKDYVSKVGYGKIIASNATNINYNTSNKTLSFAAGTYVFSETARYQLTNSQDLVFSQNGSYRLDFDVLTGEITAKASTFARTEGSIVLAFVVVSDVGIKTNDFRFAINGVLYEPINEAKDYVSKTGYGSVVGTALSNIDYTTSDRLLNFKNTVYVFSGTTRYQLTTPQSVNLATNTVYRLEFDTTTQQIEAKPYTQNTTVGKIILGFVSVSGGGITTKDFGFTVNSLATEQTKTATLHGPANSVSIDSTTGILKFTAVRVINDNSLSDIVTQELDFSAVKNSPSVHYLLFNTATKLFQFTSAISSLQTQGVLKMIATFVPNTGEIRGLTQPYTRNGQVIGGSASTNSGIILSTPLALNFNFAAQQIEISATTQVLHNGNRFILQVQNIDISTQSNSLWFALAADAKTGLIQVLPTNAAYSRDLVILGAFRKDIKAVANIDNYSINGVSNKIPDTVTSSKIPSLGWDLSGVYTAPSMPSYRNSGADPVRAIDITSGMINGWFDSLVAANPSYITKTHLGNEYTGLPINEYRFKPDMGGSTNPIKVLIHGATHGEPMSYLLPYHVMNLIANHWQESPLLEALRFGVEFSVIPALNAWGIDNDNSRYNSRGVNINRNYPVNWSSSGDGVGASAMSELETQYAYANMTAFKPHILLDVHSFGTTEVGEFMWITVESSDEARTVGASMINRMRQKWVSETPNIVSASALDRNGDAVATGSTIHTGKSLGAISVTFEVGTKILGEQPTAEHYSSLAVRYGVEALINYLIILLRRNS